MPTKCPKEMKRKVVALANNFENQNCFLLSKSLESILTSRLS